MRFISCFGPLCAHQFVWTCRSARCLVVRFLATQFLCWGLRMQAHTCAVCSKDWMERKRMRLKNRKRSRRLLVKKQSVEVPKLQIIPGYFLCQFQRDSYQYQAGFINLRLLRQRCHEFRACSTSDASRCGTQVWLLWTAKWLVFNTLVLWCYMYIYSIYISYSLVIPTLGFQGSI